MNLVPVIQICNYEGIKTPAKYPYWENQDDWSLFWKLSLKKAGFKDELKPYLEGSYFYEPRNITDRNLAKIVLDHTVEFRNGKYERDQVCCLFGGFVLRINNVDEFYPQCCGDLSNLKYWENVSNGVISYYAGHPCPNVKFENKKVIFDFTVREYEENFEPTPPKVILELNKNDLQNAVENCKIELKILAKRVMRINEEYKLGIEEIENMLIYEYSEYE